MNSVTLVGFGLLAALNAPPVAGQPSLEREALITQASPKSEALHYRRTEPNRGGIRPQGLLRNGAGRFRPDPARRNAVLVLSQPAARAEGQNTFYPQSSSAVPFSVEAWVYPQLPASGEPTRSFYVYTDDAFDVGLYRDNAVSENGGLGVKFTVWGPDVGMTLIAFRDVQEHQWNHIYTEYDSGFMRIAINGVIGPPVDVRDRIYAFWSGSDQNACAGGRSGSPQSFFSGLVDELRVSQVARYAADFSPPDVMEADAATRCLFHFDEAQGATLFSDAVANRTLHAVNGAFTPVREWLLH